MQTPINADAMQRGWLVLAKSSGSATRAGDRFNEDVGETYIWPRSIPNAAAVREGDIIALWDAERLLGFSIIESISDVRETREQYRCPNPECERLDIRERQNKSPRYKCGKCKHETDSPIINVSEETFRVADYTAAWVQVETVIDADTCRLMTSNPSTQHSIRELDVSAFLNEIERIGGRALPIFKRRGQIDPAGHRKTVVRVRKGQSKFRRALLERYGSVCAISGPCHRDVLDAAHLYSYAELGSHHSEGGLLLRRDIHRLLDLGHICIDPKTLRVSVSAELSGFIIYAALTGELLKVEVSDETKSWISKHWNQYHLQ